MVRRLLQTRFPFLCVGLLIVCGWNDGTVRTDGGESRKEAFLSLPPAGLPCCLVSGLAGRGGEGGGNKRKSAWVKNGDAPRWVEDTWYHDRSDNTVEFPFPFIRNGISLTFGLIR